MPKNATVDASHPMGARVRSSVSGEGSFVLHAKPININQVLHNVVVQDPPADKPPLPDQLNFQSGSIGFSQAPVGGWSNLTLYRNGNYHFQGHLHDSGTPSYDGAVGCVVVGQDGFAFSFGHKVHLNGFFESGSRDGDFEDTGNNPQIAQHWEQLCAHYNYRWEANVNWDVAAAVNELVGAIKAAGTIVSAVIAVVALF